MLIHKEEEPGICEECDEYGHLWWVEEESQLLCRECLQKAVEKNKAEMAALYKQ